MVDAITAKSAGQAKPPIVDTSTSAPSSAQASANLKQGITSGQPLNPRLVYDKLAGIVITQFLSQSGTIQLQTPSNAVLAYLRVGLGADGQSKYQPEPEKPNPDNSFDS